MQLFYILPIPLAFGYFLAGISDESRTDRWFSYLAGLVLSLPAVGIGVLGVSFIPDSSSYFIVQLVRSFLLESFFPYACAIIVIMFIQENYRRIPLDPVSFLFGVASFIHPFFMITEYSVPDVWATLFIPLMTLSALFVLDYVVSWRKTSQRYASSFVSVVLLVPATIVIIADFAKTMWFFAFPVWTWGLAGCFVVGSAFVLRLRKYFA